MSPDAVESYLKQLIAAAHAAPCRSIQNLRVAHLAFAVHYATPELHKLLAPALAGRQAAPEPNAFAIVATDAAQVTNQPDPPPDVRDDEVWTYRSESYFALYIPETQTTYAVEHATRRCLFFTATEDAVPVSESGAPFLPIFANALETAGLQVTHAAAIGRADAALLLVGPGGSGKSSTATRALCDGIGFLADDYCVTDSAAPPRVHALFDTTKVHVGDTALYPELAACPQRRDDEKIHFQVRPSAPGQMLAHAPLRAIAIVRVGHTVDTCVRPCSGAAAAIALAPSTLLQLRGDCDPRRALHHIRELCEALPCYDVSLGTDRGAVLTQLRELWERD